MLKNRHRFLFYILVIALSLSVFTSCAPKPGGEIPPDEGSSSSDADSTVSSDSSEPDVFYDIPYGEPVAPSDDVINKLNDKAITIGKPVAWLNVSGTTVDNAVMQYTDNEYYLGTDFWRTDYSGKFDYSGVLFADYRNPFGNRNDLSRNTVIYGHNIAVNGSNDGKRFSQLLKYEDIDFARKNQIITLETETDVMKWQVFAAFTTDTNFYYYDAEPSEEMLMHIVGQAMQRSDFEYDVDVMPQDKILTLSTCTYKYKTAGLYRTDQRYVVMAKLIAGDGNIVPADVVVNENQILPDFA